MFGKEVGQRLRGSVKWFNNDKGFGFIYHPDGQDVFVHFSSIKHCGYRTLETGEEVEYELGEGPRGFFAKNVTRLRRLSLVNLSPQEVESIKSMIVGEAAA